MGSLTNYGEQAFINHLCGTAYTPASTVYLALCTADPTDAATGASMNELPNTNGYTRKAITFGAAASRRVTQSATVTFDQFTGGSVTASHYAIVDTDTYGSGNVLCYGEFEEAKNLVNGSTPSVPSGEVYIEILAGAFLTGFVHNMLNLMFRNVAYTQPATYMGLVTTTSSDTAAGTEVSGGSYARVLINKAGGASPAFSAVSGGATDNANAVNMPTPSASWSTVVGTVLYDASSSGNAMAYDNSLTDQTVGTGDTVTFPVGSIDISIT